MANRRKKDKYVNDLFDFITVILALALLGFFVKYKEVFQKYDVVFIIGAIIFIIIIVLLFLFLRRRKFSFIYNWHSGRELLNTLRGMDSYEFEEYIADLYRRLGYKTKRVGGSHDGGIDVIAVKNGVKHYIQCKRFITSKVGSPQVRDFAGALMDKLAQGKGIFITTNIFTTEAEQFAEDKPIELIDGNRLLKLINKAGKEKENIIQTEEIKKCPLCGGQLIERNGKYGKFLGCSNYPKCKHSEKIN